MGVFSTVLADGLARGQIPGKTEASKKWFRDAARDYGAKVRDTGSKHSGRIDYQRYDEQKFLREEDPSALTNNIRPGGMYMYLYDPKWKDELPYYDRFPLLLPFNAQKDRFWGLNLHYLPLQMRAVLFDELYSLANSKTIDDKTRLRMSWQTLQAASKSKYYEPCVKQYLKSHVRTKFMEIRPEYWDMALFLPTEKFVKASKSQVWSDSKRIIKG